MSQRIIILEEYNSPFCSIEKRTVFRDECRQRVEIPHPGHSISVSLLNDSVTVPTSKQKRGNYDSVPLVILKVLVLGHLAHSALNLDVHHSRVEGGREIVSYPESRPNDKRSVRKFGIVVSYSNTELESL